MSARVWASTAASRRAASNASGRSPAPPVVELDFVARELRVPRLGIQYRCLGVQGTIRLSACAHPARRRWMLAGAVAAIIFSALSGRGSSPSLLKNHVALLTTIRSSRPLFLATSFLEQGLGLFRETGIFGGQNNNYFMIANQDKHAQVGPVRLSVGSAHSANFKTPKAVTSKCAPSHRDLKFVRDTAITGGDETKTGFYAGLLESSLVEALTIEGLQESSFFVAEALTVYQFGRLSDVYGRRPVLLLAPLGLGLAMLGFGLSKSFWMLFALLFKPSDAPRERSTVILLMWSLGSTTSPFMGGTLANAASKWPDTLGKIELLHVHPYFFPCAVAASVAFTSFAFAFVGLRETLPSAVERERAKNKSKTNEPPRETDPLLPAETSTTTGTSASASTHPDTVPPLRELFTRDVRIALLNHALLCFCDMAYDSLIPLVYSTPIAIGGLGLKPHNIGLIMGLCGFSNAVVQAAVGGRIIRHFGPRRVFNAAFCALACVFSLYPLLSVLARRAGRVDGAVVAVLVCQLSGNFVLYYSFAATMLFIIDSAPNRASVGSVTGLSQMVGTISRSVAPSIASSLFSLSVKHNLADGYLVYIFLAGISLYSR
ncbi:major facilitator superfamily domain-containing protein [Mycena leptocephala]|nr:major facilitator superfamily domain-containing protein [Mycena leptocephala]